MIYNLFSLKGFIISYIFFEVGYLYHKYFEYRWINFLNKFIFRKKDDKSV